jgi:hypothetical protein
MPFITKILGWMLRWQLRAKLLENLTTIQRLRHLFFPAKNDKYTNEYGETSRFFGEFSGLIFWNLSKKSKLGLGGRLCYGDYPFGTQWHLLPMIDFVRYVLVVFDECCR